MSIETNFKSYKMQLNKIKNKNSQINNNIIYTFDEAIEEIRDLIVADAKENRENAINSDTDNISKTREYYFENIRKKRDKISEIVYTSNISVRGYSKTKNKLNEDEYIGDMEQLIDDVVNEIFGYSILTEAMKEDNGITDIYINSWNNIYVERNGVNEKYDKIFQSPKKFENFLQRLLTEANKEINSGEKKIVDFELYGNRFCAINKSIATNGDSLVIRKHSSNHIKLNDIINNDLMSIECADILGKIILGECNLIYGGITGSGKTTTLRALLDYYVTKANKRMLVCEDTRELMPENNHTLELICSKNSDKKLDVSLDDLIITSLRLKPKYIVIGEVRGKEAKNAIEGAETGHSTIFSMHGGTTWNIINRLVTKYNEAMPNLSIDVIERIIGSAIDYIAIQDDIPNIGRRLTSIVEVKYNFNTRRIELKKIMEFNFKTKSFDIIGKFSKEKADKMMRRGISYEEIQQYIE